MNLKHTWLVNLMVSALGLSVLNANATPVTPPEKPHLGKISIEPGIAEAEKYKHAKGHKHYRLKLIQQDRTVHRD